MHTNGQLTEFINNLLYASKQFKKVAAPVLERMQPLCSKYLTATDHLNKSIPSFLETARPIMNNIIDEHERLNQSTVATQLCRTNLNKNEIK